MGPTNTALVNLFHADQQLREAEARLEAAERDVRIQERRVKDFQERVRLAQTTAREQQSKAKQYELDLGSRDAHIEKLRTQQQVAKNNKEYQTFLVEINTAKVDRNKVEEEAMRLMEAADKGQKEGAALQQLAEAEEAKLRGMKEQIGERVAKLRAEVEDFRPQRAAAAAAVPVKTREVFERLAEHHEGEAMSAIAKPDRRREEYLCTACNMELAQDVYNKLRTRDEVIYCPSCRRILYIPEGLSPEEALGTAKPSPKRIKTTTRTTTRAPKAAKATAATKATSPAAGNGESAAPAYEIELRAKGRLGELLAKSQAESVQSAVGGGTKPVECEVYVDDRLAGIYKGKSADHLQRSIRYFFEEAKVPGEVRVAAAPADEPPVEAEPATETAEAGEASVEPQETQATEVTSDAPPVPAP